MSRRTFAESVEDLEVYQLSFDVQQEVFELTKLFPRDEMFSLTNQIRRSSRSIGANLTEAWAKRRYPAHFVSKLSDSDGEAKETIHWLRTAVACRYIDQATKTSLVSNCHHINGMLNKMMSNPESWCL